MKNINKYQRSVINRESDMFGKSIEEVVRAAIMGNEPIDNVVPMIYTPEKEGVLPQYDHRTDRQEIALTALDKFNKSEAMKSEEAIENKTTPNNDA